VTGVNAGEIWVHIDPAADHDATVGLVREVIDGYPGLGATTGSFLGDRSAAALADGSGEDLVVRVYGSDAATLEKKATEIQQTVAGIAGVVDARVDRRPVEPAVEIEVDLAAAQRFNIKPGDVRRATATLLAGLEVGSMFLDQKVYEVVVWGVPGIRNDLTGVGNMLIDRPDGGQVRLRDVAAVRVVPQADSIKREAVSQYVDVVAGIGGRDPAAVTAEVEQRVRALAFPVDYRAEIVRGDGDGQVPAWVVLGVALISLVGILLVLQAALRSWALAFAMLVALPVALAGAMVGAVLGGGVLSIGSLAGFAAILAIAARQSISSIRHFRHLENTGSPDAEDLLRRGVRERLGAVVMTALATALVFVPFAVVGPVPGLEFIAPMSYVVLGGLISSTLVVLLLVPAVYPSLRGTPVVLDLGAPRPRRSAEELVGAPSL
jgi:Cu/Ag efflux pump CusA